MSTDAGSAAAPEDAATQDVSSERPGLESGDPEAADSGTSTPESADRGVEGSADGASGADSEAGGARTDAGSSGADAAGAPRAAGAGGAAGAADDGPRDDRGDEGFVAGMLRDATITGLPGETGAPPVEPHAPQAQQQGDEPVGSEPPVGDNPGGAD